jgi:hypothetical protein
LRLPVSAAAGHWVLREEIPLKSEEQKPAILICTLSIYLPAIYKRLMFYPGRPL